MAERVVRLAAAKTYDEAKDALMFYLKAHDWKVSAAGLKIPHATSPDGNVRLWFRPQAIYFTVGEHVSGAARTVTYNTNELKRLPPEAYYNRFVERLFKEV